MSFSPAAKANAREASERPERSDVKPSPSGKRMVEGLHVAVGEAGPDAGPPSTRRSTTASETTDARTTAGTTRGSDPFAFTAVDEGEEGVDGGSQEESVATSPAPPPPRALHRASDRAPSNPFAAAAKNAAMAKAKARMASDDTRLAENAREAPGEAVVARPLPHTPGLANLGNTCYLNAVLQVLCGLECFARDVEAPALAAAPFTSDSVWAAMRRLIVARRLASPATQVRFPAAATSAAATPAGEASALSVRPGVLSPAEVKRAVQRRHARYQGFHQHDAHEFLGECLDTLEEEVTAMYGKGKLPPIDAGRGCAGGASMTYPTGFVSPLEAHRRDASAGVSGGAFKRKAADLATPPLKQPAPPLRTPTGSGVDGTLTPGGATFRTPAATGTGTEEARAVVATDVVPLRRTLCPTRRNFTTVMATTLRCRACGDESTRDESFRHISVELPLGHESSNAPSELASLLSGFFATETLERRCEKPGCRGTHADLTRRIVRLPRVLILHLKRFRFLKADAVEERGGGTIGDKENANPEAAKKTAHHSLGTLRLTKVAARVTVPETLSLEAFTGGVSPSLPPPCVTAADQRQMETGTLRGKTRGGDAEAALEAAPGSAATPAVPRRLDLEGTPVPSRVDGGFSSDQSLRASHVDVDASEGTAAPARAVSDDDPAHAAELAAAIRASMGEEVGPAWGAVQTNSEERRAVNLAIEMSLAEAGAPAPAATPSEPSSTRDEHKAAAAGNETRDVAAASGAEGTSPYRLHGVISHIGATPDSGHYVAHVADRRVGAGAAPGWTTYDDGDVREVAAQAVLGMAQERQCYIAVYVFDD